MEITAIAYLKAKYGDKFNFTYHIYPSTMSEHPQYAGEMTELMDEFGELVSANADDLVQTKNPRSNEWIVVNKRKGVIVATLNHQLPDIGMEQHCELNFSSDEYSVILNELKQAYQILQSALFRIDNNSEVKLPDFTLRIDKLNINK